MHWSLSLLCWNLELIVYTVFSQVGVPISGKVYPTPSKIAIYKGERAPRCRHFPDFPYKSHLSHVNRVGPNPPSLTYVCALIDMQTSSCTYGWVYECSSWADHCLIKNFVEAELDVLVEEVDASTGVIFGKHGEGNTIFFKKAKGVGWNHTCMQCSEWCRSHCQKSEKKVVRSNNLHKEKCSPTLCQVNLSQPSTLKTLQKSKQYGGLDLPNFQYYFLAHWLQYIYIWLHSSLFGY